MPLILFPFFYLKEVLVGSALVARDSLITRKFVEPEFLDLDTKKLSGTQRYVLACLVSMTPGTLAVGESENGESMRIHSLYSGDHDAKIHELETKYRDTIAKLPI